MAESAILKNWPVPKVLKKTCVPLDLVELAGLKGSQENLSSLGSCGTGLFQRSPENLASLESCGTGWFQGLKRTWVLLDLVELAGSKGSQENLDSLGSCGTDWFQRSQENLGSIGSCGTGWFQRFSREPGFPWLLWN